MLKNVLLITLALFLSISCTKKEESVSGEVVSYLDANIPTLDPIHSTNKYSATVTANIFEGLYHYHYLKRPITVEPQLAEALPIISKDGMIYTIKIKKGVYFQNDPAFPEEKGRELEAQDFIYSWKRLADPTNKALGWWMLDGKILGLNEWRDQLRKGSANYDTPIAGLKALDKFTLEITLTKKSFQFLHILAAPPLVAVAREVVKEYGPSIGNHPVGTGPFTLKKWTRNSEVELVKNESFHKTFYPKEGTQNSRRRGLLKDAGKLLPLSEKVTIRVFTERQPLWLSFLKGKIDHGVVPKDNYNQVFENEKLLPEMKNKGVRIHPQSRPDVVFIAFNMEHPILGKNKKLRKAIAMTLDKKLILKKFYNDRGVEAQGPIPPGLAGYNENYKSPLQYDIAKAKQLLSEAGFPNGEGLPEFDYDLANTATWSRQFGELFKDEMSKIGIKIKIIPNNWPQFDKKLKTKNSTIFNMAWMADYPDSENFMQMFYGKNISPGSNNFNFVNSDYDKMYEDFLKLPPSEERYEITQKMVELLNEEVPAVYIVHRIFRLPYHTWLSNYNEYPIIYDYLKYLAVDKDKKREALKKL